MTIEGAKAYLIDLRDNVLPLSHPAFEAVTMAISALEKQEQDRWISVKDRLPEKDGHYLVTLFDEIDSWTEPLYWNTTFGGRWQGLIEDDFSDIGNVSAWRPLPEPYTEEES